MKPSHLSMMIAFAVAGPLATPSARAASPGACKLLTPAEVGSVVGATMAVGPSVNGPTSSSCEWKQQGGGVTVIVTAKSLDAFQKGKTILSPAPVSGIGDEAYQTGNSLSYTALSARRGQNAITVSVRGLKDVSAVQAAEKAIGKIAVTRL